MPHVGHAPFALVEPTVDRPTAHLPTLMEEWRCPALMSTSWCTPVEVSGSATAQVVAEVVANYPESLALHGTGRHERRAKGQERPLGQHQLRLVDTICHGGPKAKPLGSSRSVRVRLSPRARDHQTGLPGTSARGFLTGRGGRPGQPTCLDARRQPDRSPWRVVVSAGAHARTGCLGRWSRSEICIISDLSESRGWRAANSSIRALLPTQAQLCASAYPKGNSAVWSLWVARPRRMVAPVVALLWF